MYIFSFSNFKILKSCMYFGKANMGQRLVGLYKKIVFDMLQLYGIDV